MTNLNSLIVEGYLIEEPFFEKTSKGISHCTFPIASGRKERGSIDDEVSFFKIETFGKTADNCKLVGHKNRGCRVVGKLKQERWKDSDGVMRCRFLVVGEHILFSPDIGGERIEHTDVVY